MICVLTFFLGSGANIALIFCCLNTSFRSNNLLCNQSGWEQRGTGLLTYLTKTIYLLNYIVKELNDGSSNKILRVKTAHELYLKNQKLTVKKYRTVVPCLTTNHFY